MLIAFYKPFGVLSQFTADGSPNRPLAGFGFPKNVYPIGRLDAGSEGLLLLSDEPAWNARLLEPRNAHEREYWVQVECIPTAKALEQLAAGVLIRGRKTLPGRAWLLEPQPVVTPETPSSGLPATLSLPAAKVYEHGGVDRDRDRLKGAPRIPPRHPPIRFRKSVPDCWIGLELVEGRNRQVRRMTAAIGHPTLRLLRVRIGRLTFGSLPPGHWKVLTAAERKLAAGE